MALSSLDPVVQLSPVCCACALVCGECGGDWGKVMTDEQDFNQQWPILHPALCSQIQ